MIGIIIYLVIGRIIAEKRWDWNGYDIVIVVLEVYLTTFFWPIYLLWMGIKYIASLFIDIDI